MRHFPDTIRDKRIFEALHLLGAFHSFQNYQRGSVVHSFFSLMVRDNNADFVEEIQYSPLRQSKRIATWFRQA